MKMSNDNKVLEHPVVYEANGQEVKLTGNTVKNYLTRGNAEVTNQEVVMFINLCRYQQLNPFLNEAYLVKFKGSPAQIITSKEAYMKRAYENPDFDGFQAGIIVKRGEEILELEGSFSLPGDMLLGGWAKVYTKDKKYPYITKINFKEFNKGQATWRTMPKTMIRKTALVQALREAFPDNLGAMYTEEEQGVVRETRKVESEVEEEIEEMANKEVIDIPVEAVEAKQIQAPKQQQRKQRPIKQDATAQKPTAQQVREREEVIDLFEGPGF